MAGDIGGLITGLGGAVGQLFGAKGDAAEANDYQGAATLATQNAQLAATSTRIQETQTARAVTQAMGTTQADIAGAGFTESGSALDILRMNAQQGSLAKSLINVQGAINENSYAAQAGAYRGEAKAANEASDAGTISAIGSIGGALINGSGELAQAGKSVAAGYDYVTGLFTGSSAVQTTGALGVTGDGSLLSSSLLGTAGDGSVGSGLASDFGAGLSSTDFSLSAGAELGSTDVALDSSGIALGTSADAASAGIGDAILGGLTDVAGTVGDVVAGAAATAADVGASVAAAAGGLGDFLGTVGEVVGAALSVICTAYYRRGMISQELWMGAQLYGKRMDPDTFAGYLYWASPIARKIRRDTWFAKLMAPLLIPSIKEMSVIVGRPKAKRTLYGYISHRAMFALSWAIGRIIKGDEHANART